jgi:TRAP-type transport system periplasmic protein
MTAPVFLPRLAQAALISLVLASAFTSTSQAQTTLTFGGSDAIGSILDKQNLAFTKCVNDAAAGKLKVNFIQGEQLGTDMQVIEQMMQGSVHIYGDVLDWYSNWVKDFSILAWGFTFKDADHMQRFLDSDTYTAMAEKLRKEQGLRILAASPTQPRILFSKKPVKSLADLAGVKMRVPEIKTYLMLWETLGTKPSRLAWGEIYLGLKTGVVEAAEGPISSAYSAKFHEAVKNVTRTDHLMSSAHITMNEKSFSALPADQQTLLSKCARESVLATRQMAQKDTDETVAKMTAEGATVSTIDKAPIQQKAKDAVVKMEGDGVWSAGLWDRIQKM